MDRCAPILIVLVCILSTGLCAKYDHITKCVYTSVADFETFDFICEPQNQSTNFFDNNETEIFCDSDDGRKKFRKDSGHGIRFQNCSCKQLPDIFKSYTALRQLNVSSLGLERLRREYFDDAKNLSTLIASHNQLTDLSSSLLACSNKLSAADFSFNKIDRIDPFAFSNTESNITLLNLSHNSEIKMENRPFMKLFQLEVLDLSFNRMSHAPDRLFDELVNLSHLNLADNELQQLNCLLFAYLINLKILNLSRNKLQVFDSGFIGSAQSIVLLIEGNRLSNLMLSGNVSEINASANDIRKIVLEGLDNMTVFNISKNNVENVTDVIKQLSSQLRILDVSDSTVGMLNIHTFAKFDHLEHLSLRNTSLSNIQYGTFHNQQKLLFMDLSDNDLKKIDFQMLHWNSGKLKTFYLGGNALDNLNNLTRVNYPSLQSVSIDGNNFDCGYLSGLLQLWKKDRISVVFSPHRQPDVHNSEPHINGIICHHVEAGGYSFNKIETLLICIVVVLQCLLIVLVWKNCFPCFNCRSAPAGNATDKVYYQKLSERGELI